MGWILLDKNTSSREILLPDVEDILDKKGIFLSCKKIGAGWGLVQIQDQKVIWKIQSTYEDAGSFSEGVFPCKKGDKWGFLDENGEIALPFDWDYVQPFNSGLSVAAQNEKWGVINKKGEWVISPSADYLRSYSDNLAVGRIRGTWFVLNPTGKTVLTPCVDFIGSFVNGLAAVNRGGKLIQPQLIMGGHWGFLNSQGKLVIPLEYSWVGNFISDYAPYYKESQDEWGLLSQQGVELPLAGVSAVRGFSEDLVLVEKNGLWGFLDLQGKEIIPCAYAEAKLFADGMAFVFKEDEIDFK